jgi:hypothetical protein
MNKHLCAYSYSLLLLVLRPYSASCPMNKDLQEVAIDLSEVALGSLTDNEIVKDIPVIGTFLRLARVTMSIPDRIFAKKLERFISVIDSIPLEKRHQFHARLKLEKF